MTIGTKSVLQSASGETLCAPDGMFMPFEARMSAEIIQFVPRPNPNRSNPIVDLTQLAVDIVNDMTQMATDIVLYSTIPYEPPTSHDTDKDSA